MCIKVGMGIIRRESGMTYIFHACEKFLVALNAVPLLKTLN